MNKIFGTYIDHHDGRLFSGWNIEASDFDQAMLKVSTINECLENIGININLRVNGELVETIHL
jgi:hypothetical protein